MNKERFNKLLKEAQITKTDFAKQFKLTVGTVNNWGSSKEIPYWVESWLENYIKAKVSDDIIKAVKPFVK